MTLRILLLAAFMLVPMFAHAEPRRALPNFGVLGFYSPDGALTDAELELLTEAFRGALVKEAGTRFKVLTSDAMAMMLPPEKQRECAGECSLEIGRKANVEFIADGKVRAVGGMKILSVESYSVIEGRLLGTQQIRGATFGALLNDVDSKGREIIHGWLALLAPSSTPGPVVAETKLGGGSKAFDFGDAEDVVAQFDAEPAGAIVLLDGQMLCPQTPCSKTVSSGAHDVLITMDGYDSVSQQLEVSAKNKRFNVKLPANFALLSVITTPPGLPITVDGKPFGASPISDKRVDARAHDVMVADPCYGEVGERVVVGKGEKRTLRLEAEPRWAGLKVSAEDERGNALEAEIEVDGQGMGKTPKQVKVPMCSKELKVKSGALGAAVKLALQEGEKKAVPLVLKALGPPPGVFKAAGHEWQAEPSPNGLDWEAAKAYCARLPLAGGGWRLPDKDELKALYDARQSVAGNNSIKGIDGGWYWSSSPDAGNHAWGVDFGSGLVDCTSRNDELGVRCVR